MKKLIVFAAAILLTFSAYAQDGRSIYNKYSDEPGVSAVYISPSMFKLMGRIPSIELGQNEKMDITPIVKSLKGFYLISSSNKDIKERLNSDVKRFLNSGKFELMMEAKDSGDAVRIYTDGDESIIHSFLMMATDRDDTTFISMDGLINREDLEKLVGAAMENM